MRVAQRMISRNYKRQINSSLKKSSDALERSESGLAFKRLSENVASGTRAMHIQEQRYAAMQQLDNVKNLMAEQKSIDSNLDSIHSMLQKIQESVLTGMSEDWGATSREVLAQQISQKMEQLLQFANAQFGGHTLFGGTNNSTPPFTVSDEGKLQFNGIDVDQIFKSALDGKFYYTESNENGDWKYTINGEEYFSSDGVTFYQETGDTYFALTDANENILTSTDGKTFTDGNGNAFEFDPDAGQYTQVVIGNEVFTLTSDGVYANATNDKFYGSEDGLTFFELDNSTNNPPSITDRADDAEDITFAAPEEKPVTVSFVLDGEGGYSQVVIDGAEYTLDETTGYYTNATTGLSYEATKTADGWTFTNATDPTDTVTFDLPQAVIREVPNSGPTYADIGLGLVIRGSDMMADPRTAYQVSFSGLDILGFAGVSYDDPPSHPGTITGAQHGTEVSGNLYDLLGQIQNALAPDFNKSALDDLFTQLVNLTDKVGMVRTDLGNRMEYLELTETRLDDDIQNMTELESDLISSDPAMEAIKMKECEYVWLALMQLGSKVLPASLLDFMS